MKQKGNGILWIELFEKKKYFFEVKNFDNSTEVIGQNLSSKNLQFKLIHLSDCVRIFVYIYMTSMDILNSNQNRNMQQTLFFSVNEVNWTVDPIEVL